MKIGPVSGPIFKILQKAGTEIPSCLLKYMIFGNFTASGFLMKLESHAWYIQHGVFDLVNLHELCELTIL